MNHRDRRGLSRNGIREPEAIRMCVARAQRSKTSISRQAKMLRKRRELSMIRRAKWHRKWVRHGAEMHRQFEAYRARQNRT